MVSEESWLWVGWLKNHVVHKKDLSFFFTIFLNEDKYLCANSVFSLAFPCISSTGILKQWYILKYFVGLRSIWKYWWLHWRMFRLKKWLFHKIKNWKHLVSLVSRLEKSEGHIRCSRPTHIKMLGLLLVWNVCIFWYVCQAWPKVVLFSDFGASYAECF